MKTLLACSAAFVVLWSSVCAAQEQRQRNGRARQGPGRYSSSPQDMQSRLQRFEAFLRQFDVNGDGTIQPSEIPRERKSLFDRLARRVGLDPNTSIPVAQFREASMRRYSQGASHGARPGPPPGGMPGGPPGSGYPGGVPPGGAAPGMPGMAGRPPGMAPPTGFVATPTSPGTAPVAGFGASPATTPAGEAAAPTTNVSGSPGASTTPPPGAVSPPPTVVPAQPTTIETQVKCQYYARSLLRQFDANRSGALEKEEWEKARPDPKAADRNGDSVINLDELTAWVLESMQKGVAS